MHTLFRLAFLPLLRRPGLGLLAVLILALGIVPMVGAWSFFGLLRGGLGSDPAATVCLQKEGARDESLSPALARDLIVQAAPFARVWGLGLEQAWLGRKGEGEDVAAARLAPADQEAEGVSVALGRAISASDVAPGAPPVALVSRPFWRRHLEGDPAAIGRVLRLNGEPVQVVGVMGPGRGPLMSVHVLRPLGPVARFPTLMARLAPLPGWTRARVARELVRLGEGLASAHPAFTPGTTLGLMPPEPVPLKPALLLLGLALPCFLVACAAVTALLLAIGVDRHAETALRNALGASRLRILLEGLAPALVLGLAAALLAWKPALWLTLSLPPLLNPAFLVPEQPFLPLFLGVAGAGFLASLTAGAWPAWKGSGADPARLLGRGTTSTPRPSGLLRVLVAGQVAVALALLGLSGLFWHHQKRQAACEPVPAWRNLVAVDPPGSYVGTFVGATISRHAEDPESIRLRAAAEGAPGVRQVTQGRDPFRTLWLFRDRVRPVGHTPWTPCTLERGAAGWAEVRGVRRLAGREAVAPGEVEIGKALAGRLFPGGEALGRVLEAPPRRDRPGARSVVVGILEDIQSPNRPGLPLDLVLTHGPQMGGLVLRVDDGSPRAVAALKAHLESAMGQPLSLRSGLDLMRDTAERGRVLAGILGSLGTAALLLALAGLTGLQVFLVDRRRTEFGIRTALGARTPGILRQVALESLRLAAWGLPLGLLGALGLGALAATRFESFHPVHLASLAALVALIPSAIVLAALLPALRAARVAPAQALRSE